MINGIKNLFGDTCRNIIKNTLFLRVSPNIKFIPYASKNGIYSGPLQILLNIRVKLIL